MSGFGFRVSGLGFRGLGFMASISVLVEEASGCRASES